MRMLQSLTFFNNMILLSGGKEKKCNSMRPLYDIRNIFW